MRRGLVGVMATLLVACATERGYASGDSNERLSLVLSQPRVKLHPSHARTPDPDTTSQPSAAGLLARTTVRAYQLLLSSQDKPSCQFTPSCSNYCTEAIRAHGVIRGVLMCSDRIMRCHPGAALLYERDPETGRALDSPTAATRDHTES